MDEEKLTINEAYAAKYDKWRAKEELQKLKDKYGDQEEYTSSSSDSESEDEDAEALTPQVEKDWLRTLSAIKSKHPSIYNKNTTFYHEQDEGMTDKEKRSKSQKPVTLKDMEREDVLKKARKFDDVGEVEDSSDDDDDDDDVQRSTEPGYHEEQELIKDSFKAALADSDEEDILTLRQKSKEEQVKEEEEYLSWLKDQESEAAVSSEIKQDLDPLKSYLHKPDLSQDEQFVWNYILNKGYLEQDDTERPSYEDIVGFDEEEEELEKQAEFERGVNFRFEEPDQEFIKRYPRFMANSVRKKDERRKIKRQEIRERKAKEKEKKKEELKRLKNLKRKEIMEKLDQLKEITGNPYVGFTEEDMTEDFDPEKHDAMMKRVFDAEYENEPLYEKPLFSEDEDDFNENWDEWQGREESEGETEVMEYDEPHCEDEGFIMDADYDPNQPQPSTSEPTSNRKKRKKSKFAKLLEKKKPVFNPVEKSFESYVDEVYGLEYEDIIDDLPCRFKYRQTTANDFGLSTEEVLCAETKELNQWASLKKMIQYRAPEEEKRDKERYRMKAKNTKKKYNILASLTQREENDEDSQKKKKKKKKRKRKKKSQMNPKVGQPSNEPPVTTCDTSDTPPATTHTTQVETKTDQSTDNDVTTVTNGTKKTKKRKRSNFDDTLMSGEPSSNKKQARSDQGEVTKISKSDKPEVAKISKSDKAEGTKISKSDQARVAKIAKSDKAEVTKKPVGTTVDRIRGSEKETNSEHIKGDNKKLMKKSKKKGSKTSNLSDARLKAYGINPKSFKYTYGKKHGNR